MKISKKRIKAIEQHIDRATELYGISLINIAAIVSPYYYPKYVFHSSPEGEQCMQIVEGIFERNLTFAKKQILKELLISIECGLLKKKKLNK